MNIQEYEQELKNHDWTYEYSDDHQVYLRGVESLTNIVKLAGTNEEFKELFNQYKLKYLK